MNLYINGTLVDIDTGPTGLVHNDDNMYLAKYYISAPSYYEGLSHQMRIWNRELSQLEIQSYMSTAPTGNESGLVGYWNFNEGTGNTASDATSNSNDGTIYGDPVWVENAYGCSTEPDACNYEEGGNFTNEICLYDDCEGVCGGESLADNCGECGGDGSSCFYSVQIQSIFNDNCVSCHGGQNNLFLNSYSNVMAGNSNNGPVIIPNDADGSLLWQYINSDYMPIGGSNLTSEQKTTIAQWINDGAGNDF